MRRPFLARRPVTQTLNSESLEPQPSTRRDFLFIATGAFALVGTAATLWPLVDQMQPDAQTIAAGAPFDVDLSSVKPGQQIVVLWRGHPIFVVNRPPEALATLRDPALLARLRGSRFGRAPAAALCQELASLADEQWAVFIGVCTHLGCIPLFEPNKGQQGPDWPGGWFCPCHGSKYDLAARVYKDVPAPYNLPVPPYRMVNAKTSNT